MLLSMKNDAPVWTTIILLSRRHGAPELVDGVSEDRGTVRLLGKPRVLKLWEQSAEAVLAESNVEAPPLIGGMKATREELSEAITRLTTVADRDLRSRLFAERATWSRPDYNEIEIEEIRARMSMTLRELMLISPAGEELAGEKLGEAGREAGRPHRSLLLIAGARFPGLLDRSVVDRMEELDEVHALAEAFLQASSADAARAVLESLVRNR